MARITKSRRDEARDPAYLREHFYMRDGRLYRDINRFGHLVQTRQGVPLKNKRTGELHNWVRFDGARLRADHIMIAVVDGAWPDDVVHEDGNTLNDGYRNLTGVYGFGLPKGVTRSGSKFSSKTWVLGHHVYHGVFENVLEAVRAREEYAERMSAAEEASKSHRPLRAHNFYSDPEPWLGGHCDENGRRVY